MTTTDFDPDLLPGRARTAYDKWVGLGGEHIILEFHREAVGFIERSRANGAEDFDIRAYLGGIGQDHAAEWIMSHPDSYDPATAPELLAIIRGVLDQLIPQDTIN